MKIKLILCVLIMLAPTVFSQQIQIAFSGESTEEIIKSLTKASSLGLSKPIQAKGSLVSLRDMVWNISEVGSVVYINKEKLDQAKNCLAVKKMGAGYFFIHILRITPPNKVELLDSFKIDSNSTHCFNAYSDKPLKTFVY